MTAADSKNFERTLLWVIRIGVFLLLLTPVILFKNFFFPFITGKNFYFRILVELVFAAWVVLAALAPEYRPRRGPVLYAVSAFIGILGIATLFGVNPYHSFWSNFERMEGYVTHLHLLALFLVLASTMKTKKEWFYFANAAVIVGAYVAAYGFLQSVHILTLSGEGRPYATLGNTIYLAVYMMFNFFILGSLLYSVRVPGARVAYALALALDAYIFFLAASRGAFIGFAIGTSFVALGALFISRSRRVRVSAVAGIAVFIVLAAVIIAFPKSGFVQSNQLFSRFAATLSQGFGHDPRIMIWGIAWNSFLQRPLLGWGPENFISAYSKNYNPNLFGNEPWFDRAHNMLLEWLVASGIIGFIAYAAIFASISVALWKLGKSKKLDPAVCLMVGGLFIAYVVQNIFVFDNIVTYLVIFSVLAFVHAISTSDAHVPSKRFIPQALTAGSIMIVALIAMLYFFNIKPVIASLRIIDALKSIATNGTASTTISSFDAAISENTFGTSEARERLVDTATTLILNSGSQPSADNALLLKKSISELEKENQDFPGSAKINLFLGKAYAIQYYSTHDVHDFINAEKAYDHALEFGPGYVQTYLARSELYLVAGQYDKAKKEVASVWGLTHQSAGLMYDVVSTYVLSNDAVSAKEVFLKFVEENHMTPEHNSLEADGLGKVASRTMRVQNPQERVDFLMTLLKYREEVPEIHIVLAQTYVETGNKNEAIREAKRAGELKPELQPEVDQFIKSLGGK